MANESLHSTAIRRISFVPTEDYEMKALVKWLTYQKIIHYHIPNGGYRNAKEAAKLKRCGVKSGIPDLCIPIAKKPYHGLYIELKRRDRSKSVISKNQKKWIIDLRIQGYCVEVAYGWEEAVKLIETYLEK